MVNPQGTAHWPATAIDNLTILFIGLKLANIINWSWFWVLSPQIFVLTLVVAIMVFGGKK